MRSNATTPRFISPPRRLLSALLFTALQSLACVSFSSAENSVANKDSVADSWLRRFAQSMSELNYRGIMTYTRGEHQEAVRVTHGMYNGEQYERLEHLDGERREVIRHGQQLICIQLGQRLDLLFHRHLLREGLAELDPYYEITVGGEDRVAGRRAINLSIKARDEFRFGYRLALDYDTGLLLRSESVDAMGHVLERLQFVEVDIGQPLKKEWLGDIRTAKAAPDPMPIDRVIEEGQMAWKPQWLPPGFALALAPHRPSEEVLTYSDGLAVISVFVEAHAGPLPSGDGSAAQGATNAYTRPVQHGVKPHLIVVVGEVPAATAKRVANSVMWESPPSSDAAGK